VIHMDDHRFKPMLKEVCVGNAHKSDNRGEKRKYDERQGHAPGRLVRLDRVMVMPMGFVGSSGVRVMHRSFLEALLALESQDHQSGHAAGGDSRRDQSTEPKDFSV